MPLERGGRADKLGNRYEIKCIIYELLKVLKGDNYSVTIEALGPDEMGTDILVYKKDGTIEHQQCKVRNASMEYWRLSDLNARKIFETWSAQLMREDKRHVAVVSAIGCSFLVDLHDRAMNASERTDLFYEWQIKESDQKFITAYEQFCGYMGLDCSRPNDIQTSVSFLKRIHFYHVSEELLRENNKNLIEFLFCTEYQTVYNALLYFVNDKEILGKEITATFLRDFFQDQEINFRLMDSNPSILQCIEELNREFHLGFLPLHRELIDRPEFEECIDVLKNEKNLIISGNAGYGKSGCAEAIVNYCKNEKIPYIALKLDRRIPRGNSEAWGKELGLGASVSYALHSISKNEQAVLLLDQLDALRWTQSNSSEALCVCMELIRQVKQINITRDKKISIVFVCRRYDLNNDNNIKLLFETAPTEDGTRDSWKIVNIQLLNEKTVEHIVGKQYSDLTSKTKRLLRVPSNLYIWTHLEEQGICKNYDTTSGLIEEWFQQILKKSVTVGIEEKSVLGTIDEIVNRMNKKGCLFVPKTILTCGEIGIDYLVSSDMLSLQENKVGFIHQSLLDYFISKQMSRQYWNGEDIETIIGEKDKQIPSRCYQVQMFMQHLLEFDSQEFIDAGKQLIESTKIRYYIKYVFYELLSQIEEPDKTIEEFIVENCEHPIYGEYLINNVVYGNTQYVKILIRNNILRRWMETGDRKKGVFSILRSISLDLDPDSIQFIREFAFVEREDDILFADCFLHGIENDSDELFNLRLDFYKKYPELIGRLYVDVKKCFTLCEKRIVRLIAYLLQNKKSEIKSRLYNMDEIFSDDELFSVKDGEFVLTSLLKIIPQENGRTIAYSEWSRRHSYNRHTVERLAVETIKKANKNLISIDSNLFWQYYSPYMGKNFAVMNEIILDALQYLPAVHSNKVISYLTSSMDSNIFDETSDEKNKLNLAEKVLERHTVYCDDAHIKMLEKSIQKYISPKAREWYKYRIEWNKENKDSEPVYWSFWGDLQFQLLRSVANNRLSPKSKDLLRVLQRRFERIPLWYDCEKYGHSGTVVSPVSRKSIRKEQWLQIIQNKKLQERKSGRWEETEDGFIESSIEMYASDFRAVVSENPNEMIQLVLDNKEKIPACYVLSMFAGAALSDNTDSISQETWEEMFRSFPCDTEDQMADYFCTIIEKTNIFEWSADILSQLKNIAASCKEEEKQDLRQENSDTLYNGTLNTVKGNAARAIGHLLWEKTELLSTFKEIIKTLSLDENPTIQMASMYTLWPAYNIDETWASEILMTLYEKDIRMAAFYNSKDMFFLLYPKFEKRILDIVQKCFDSDDKRLIEVGGHSICEFYLLKGEFSNILSSLEKYSQLQLQSILEMAVIYISKDEYRENAKEIILRCRNSSHDIEYPLSKIFYDNLVDVQRDSDFLKNIMKGKVNRKLVFSFVHFLEENAYSVKDFADVIITLCESALHYSKEELTETWGVAENLSKLIITLYDECANSKSPTDKAIAQKCLEFWDTMFEKQIGQTRKLSQELMER
ncbi:MAG: hypothetical protein ACLUJC_04490 [Clostridia bacterium]